MIGWAIETLIATTALMLLVLAIRRPVRRAFGPDVTYALWAIPVLRMILPPLPESWRQSVTTPIAQAGEVVTYYVTEPMGGYTPADFAAATPSGPDLLPQLLLGAWVIGAIGFVGYHLITYSRFCARVRRMAGAARIVAAGNVAVIETAAAAGPLAFGIWRKYVAFPRDFAERYDAVERDLALAHELGHHARGDLIANWAALVMLGLHWFNPVAWRAYRAFRADQEMACDALVLAGREAGLRHAYGRAIVKSAHGGAVSAACHLHTINDIKGRLRMLTRHERTSRKRLVAGGGTVAALVALGLVVTASGTQAAEKVRSGIEKTTGVDIASLELPALPQTPPAPPEPVAPTVAPVAPVAPAAPTRRVKRVTIITGKDGKVITETIDDAAEIAEIEANVAEGKARVQAFAVPVPPMPPAPPSAVAFKIKDLDKMQVRLRAMPVISSRDCRSGEGDGTASVIQRDEGGKRVTIICQNRIRLAARSAEAAHAGAMRANVAAMQAHAAAMRAQAAAMRESQMGYRSALIGLRSARRSIEMAQGMTDAQRATALEGIDEAIRDVEKDARDD